MTSDTLLPRLRRAFHAQDFERGLRYFGAGRVRSLNILERHADGVRLAGRVLGSNGREYEQNVYIDWDASGVGVYGLCSCPVGVDCKHVVAVCLAWQSQRDKVPAGPAAEEVTWRRWLTAMESAGRGTTGAAAAARRSEDRLLYLVTVRPDEPVMEVELRIARPLKNDPEKLGKGRKVSLERLLDAFDTPACMNPDDQELARLLMALCPGFWDSTPEITGRNGYLALQQMLATGRCFLAPERQPLHWGEARALELDWQEVGGRLRLTATAGGDASLVTTEPPVFVDEATGMVGPLETRGLGAAQLQTLLDAPALPSSSAETLTRLLVDEFSSLPVPLPAGREISELAAQAPVPCLTLAGEHWPSRGFVHVLRLEFAYDGHRVTGAPGPAHALVRGPSGPVRVQRDAGVETAALDRLTDTGFEPVAEAAGHTADLRLYSAASSLVESASRWSAFIREEVPRLRDEGWQVDFDPSFQLRFDDGDWHGEVETPETGGQDWFGLRFDLDVNGQRVPLLPLIMPLLKRGFGDALPERVSIPLRPDADGRSLDHRYVDLPVERLRPFLETLRDLFDGGRTGNGEVIEMPRFEAPVVARLEAAGTRVDAPAVLKSLGERLAGFFGMTRVPVPDGLQADLRDYQRTGLDWLQFLREYDLGGILADDMGLGKTLQTLAHLLTEKEAGRLDRPALVVAPTSLIGNWRREAARFAPALSVLVLHGPQRKTRFADIPHHDLVLTSYPLLPRDGEELDAHRFHVVVLDEAQTVKNPRAKAAVAVRALKARHRLCLTGTPMENHLGELWAQFDFLLPGLLGAEDDFRRRWRKPIEEHGNDEVRERLARRLAPFMLRRRKTDVLDELPPKTEILRTVALGDRQAALYESVRLAMEEKVRRAVAEQGLARSHITILDALLKLRQTCCDPRLLPLEAARGVKGSAKLELLMEMVPELLEEGRRVLLFSQFTSMLGLIEAELDQRGIGYAKLTGQTRHRDAAIERFRSGQANLFLISLKAGGVGLNLPEADAVILYDPWWNPAVESQAADRAHRIGQTQQVFVYRLVAEGTVEEKILALQDKKRALSEGVYAEGTASGAPFEAEDLQRLLAAD